VGKGEEMSSAESSRQQRELIDEKAEEIPRSYEYSRGTVSHVNEYNENLKTSFTEGKG
jgi:hypothetical protein